MRSYFDRLEDQLHQAAKTRIAGVAGERRRNSDPRRRRPRRMATVLSALAVALSLVIAAGATLLLHGHSRSTPTGPAPTSLPAFDPQSASFISPAVGWAWGPAKGWNERGPGLLARTTDGGRTWTVVPASGIDYGQAGLARRGASGVYFVNRSDGYLFGGSLYVTTDGGSHWSKRSAPGQILDVEGSPGHLYALVLACATDNACLTANLYRLTDSGGTFKKVGAVPAVQAGASLIVRDGSVYLLGARHSGSAGSSFEPMTLWALHPGGGWHELAVPWSQKNTQCAAALAAWSASGLVVVCGGEPAAGIQAKTFYSSTDGGRTWTVVPASGGMSPGYVADLAAASSSTWALAEARGAIEVTHDGGRHWTTGTSTAPKGVVEGWGQVMFTDPMHLVAVPTFGGAVLASSSDAGRTWTVVSFPSGGV